MRKSRFLALFLTVVFILANVTIPSFAAFTKTPSNITGENGRYIVAPLGDLPFHIPFTVDDPTATYSIARRDGTDIVWFENPSDALNITNGLLTINSAAGIVNTGVHNTIKTDTTSQYIDVSWTGTEPGSAPALRGVYPARNFDFNDTTVELGTNHPLATTYAQYAEKTPGSGDYYLQGTRSTSVVTNAKTLGFERDKAAYSSTKANSKINTIMEAELYGCIYGVHSYTSETINDCLFPYTDAQVSAATTAGATNHGLPNGFDIAEWNRFKWVIDWTEGYDLYINDHLYMSNVPITPSEGFNKVKIYFRGSGTSYGVDNFKFYSTTLDFPYDVELTAADNKIGSTITVSAFKSDLISEVEDELDYAFFVSSTEDGEYTLLSDVDSDSYEIQTADAEKFIKAAARVREIEYDYCSTDWVLSDDAIQVEAAPVETISWASTPDAEYTDVIYSPYYTGEVYELPYSITGSFSTTSEIAVSNSLDGKVSVTNVPGKSGAIVSINNNALAAEATTYVSYPNGDATKKALNIKPALFEDFEDGTDDVIVTYAQSTTEIITEGNNKYANVGVKKLTTQTSPMYPSGGIYVLDADVEFAADAPTPQFRLRFGADYTYDVYFLADSVNGSDNKGFKLYGHDETLTEVDYGWRHVRMIFDLINKRVSCFVDEKPVVVNHQYNATSTIPTRIEGWYGHWDNISRSTVTVKTPVAYNLTMSSPVVGEALTTDFDFYCGATDYVGAPTTVEYFTSVKGSDVWESKGPSFTPQASDAGKLVKVRVTPKANYYFDEILTGAAVETVPVVIPNVIPVISLSVNDAPVADLSATNIKTDANLEAGTATLDVTINAKAANPVTVKFVLAQYKVVAGKLCLANIKLTEADLTETSADYTISDFVASDLAENSRFKLYMFTSDGLVPVNNEISFN